MIDGHGDDIFRYGGGAVRINFSTNIWQNADHSGLLRHLAEAGDIFSNYPEPEPRSVESLLAAEAGVGAGNVIVTNGATEAVYLLAQLTAPGPSAVVVPTFREYQDACRVFGHKVLFTDSLSQLPPGCRTVWLCNPNNPTGTALDAREIAEASKEHPDKLFVLDQAYADYSAKEALAGVETVSLENMVSLHSLTKRFAIPGLRIGYAVGSERVISALRRLRMPWSVNAVAIEVPQFSDARLQDSVPQQITAAGAQVAPTAASADLILALNTPPDGLVKDSTADENQYFASAANKRYVAQLKQLLHEGSTPVSLADISYSNGGDNGFMQLLARSTDLGQLAAYNGWNTADNAVGYAIAQGLLAPYMLDAARLRLLRQRLIDDWYYQSNARRRISDELEKHDREDMKYELLQAQKPVLDFVTKQCQRMAKQYALTKDTQFKLSFPWDRLFEVEVELKK